jgi:HEPN domain-containing protein
MSDVDLEMAAAGLERGLYAPCVFHSQQAVEKLLKAIWIERVRDEPPPRTHNLVDLARELGLLSQEHEEFLRKLSNQAVASRYVGREAYSQDAAREYYEGARALCELLRQNLR